MFAQSFWEHAEQDPASITRGDAITAGIGPHVLEWEHHPARRR
ncbi:hypothetical protein [Leucobacter soli]